jgi:hypothetical protein
MTASGIYESWARLSVPSDRKELVARHVPRTNAWVFKDHAGGFGMMLTGVHRAAREPHLRNIHLSFHEVKIIMEGGSGREVSDCLQVAMDPSCSGEALATVIERLGLNHPDGAFSTDDLIAVLDDAAELFLPTRPGPSKEAVVGAWGELYLIELLMNRARDADAQDRIVRAWEAEGPARDMVDFRFSDSTIILEVKTTMGERIHHIGGLGQVTTPPTWAAGYLVSVAISETSAGLGRTTSDICAAIRSASSASGIERTRFGELLEAKLSRRGEETQDSRFRFTTQDDPMMLYPFGTLPKPKLEAGVSDVEWTAALHDSPPLSLMDAEAALTAAVGASDSRTPHG